MRSPQRSGTRRFDLWLTTPAPLDYSIQQPADDRGAGQPGAGSTQAWGEPRGPAAGVAPGSAGAYPEPKPRTHNEPGTHGVPVAIDIAA